MFDEISSDLSLAARHADDALVESTRQQQEIDRHVVHLAGAIQPWDCLLCHGVAPIRLDDGGVSTTF